MHKMIPILRFRTKKTAKDVATPFPPLNLSHTGNIWPKIAQRPDVMSTVKSSKKYDVTKIATAPLEASSIKVSNAINLPDFRSTLVAPIFPEPCLRISPCPAIFVRINPKGTEPKK